LQRINYKVDAITDPTKTNMLGVARIPIETDKSCLLLFMQLLLKWKEGKNRCYG